MVLFIWTVLSFTISAGAWTYLYSQLYLKVSVTFIIGLLACMPMALVWYFHNVWRRWEGVELSGGWDDAGELKVEHKTRV